MRLSTTSTGSTILLVVSVLVVAFEQPAFGQDTLLINCQRRLTDRLGEPVTRLQTTTFAVYDSEELPQWSEEHSDGSVSDGLFSVILGSHTALPDSIFGGEALYLGITPEGGDGLEPRTLFTSTPGAVVSRRVVGVPPRS